MSDMDNLFKFLSQQFGGSGAKESLKNLEKTCGNGDETLIKSEFNKAVQMNWGEILTNEWNGEYTNAKDLVDKFWDIMDTNQLNSKIQGTTYTEFGAISEGELNNIDALGRGFEWGKDYTIDPLADFRNGLQDEIIVAYKSTGSFKPFTIPNNVKAKWNKNNLFKYEGNTLSYTANERKSNDSCTLTLTLPNGKSETFTFKVKITDVISALQEFKNTVKSETINVKYGTEKKFSSKFPANTGFTYTLVNNSQYFVFNRATGEISYKANNPDKTVTSDECKMIVTDPKTNESFELTLKANITDIPKDEEIDPLADFKKELLAYSTVTVNYPEETQKSYSFTIPEGYTCKINGDEKYFKYDPTTRKVTYYADGTKTSDGCSIDIINEATNEVEIKSHKLSAKIIITTRELHDLEYELTKGETKTESLYKTFGECGMYPDLIFDDAAKKKLEEYGVSLKILTSKGISNNLPSMQVYAKNAKKAGTFSVDYQYYDKTTNKIITGKITITVNEPITGYDYDVPKFPNLKGQAGTTKLNSLSGEIKKTPKSGNEGAKRISWSDTKLEFQHSVSGLTVEKSIGGIAVKATKDVAPGDYKVHVKIYDTTEDGTPLISEQDITVTVAEREKTEFEKYDYQTAFDDYFRADGKGRKVVTLPTTYGTPLSFPITLSVRNRETDKYYDKVIGSDFSYYFDEMPQGMYISNNRIYTTDAAKPGSYKLPLTVKYKGEEVHTYLYIDIVNKK